MRIIKGEIRNVKGHWNESGITGLDVDLRFPRFHVDPAVNMLPLRKAFVKIQVEREVVQRRVSCK